MSTVEQNEKKVVLSGETLDNYTVLGEVVVSSGGIVNDTVISGGAMYVHSGAVNNVNVSGGTFAVYGGGTASGANVYLNGSASVNSGAVAVDTVVNSGGKMSVTFDGVASNVVLHSGGSITLGGNKNVYLDSSTVATVPGGTVAASGVTGGILTGVITIDNGAFIKAEEGAMIVFDLTEIDLADDIEDTFFINNLSAIKGDASCYITVDANIADGTYLLAQNVNSFTGSYKIGSISDTYDKYITLTAGVASGDYMLAVEDADGDGANDDVVLKVGSTRPVIGVSTEDLAQEVLVTATNAVEYKIGNGMWKVYQGAVSILSNTIIYFRSADGDENSREITNIDRIKPTVSVDGPEGGAYNNITLTVNPADNRDDESNVLTIEYKFNNGAWQTLSGNTLSVTANGEYTFKVTDAAGNVSDEVTWNVDNYDITPPQNPPTLSFSQVIDANGVDGTVYNGVAAQKVVVNAVGDSDTVRIVYQSYDFERGDWSYDYVDYPAGGIVLDTEGRYLFQFRCYDEAGNFSSVASYLGEIVIDKTAPDAPVAAYSQDSAQSVDVTLTAETGATIQYKFEGEEEWKTYDPAVGLTVANPSKLIFRAIDAAGNVSVSSEADLTGIIDIIPPAKPTASVGVKDADGKVAVTAAFEEGTTGYYSANGKPAAVCGTAPVKLSQTGYVEFWSVDAAGNKSEVLRVDIDLTAPAVPTLESVTRENTTIDNESVFVKAAFDDNSTKEYRVNYGDGFGEWQTYNAETGAEIVKNGIVQFRAKEFITDTDANDNITFATYENISGILEYEVTNIDLIPPKAPVAIADNEEDTKEPVSVMATFDELAVENQYSLDGGLTWETYSKAITFTKNGSVIFRSYDEYGNYIDTRYDVNNIDIVPPEAPAAVADITEATTADVTVTATFDVNSVKNEYSLDGSNWTIYTQDTPFQYTFTENGTIYFRSWDSVGNFAVSSYEVDNIDKTAPELSNIVADVTAPTNGNVKVTVDCNDAEAKVYYYIEGVTSDWQEYTDGVVVEKNGTVEFKAVDKLGNTSVTISKDITNIDKEAPVISDIAADITSAVNGNVVVTATFAADAVKKEYSVDGGATWQEYVDGVLFEQNGSVIFRAEDVLGNANVTDAFEVNNIDKTVPVAPMVYISTRKPTKELTITASHTEAGNVTIQYKKDGETEWSNYTGAFNVDKNATYIFSAVDAAGNRCDDVIYEITNIDDIKPVITNVESSTEEPTAGNVIVTPVCDDPEAKIYYFINGVTADWTEYTDGVVIEQPGVVQFKAIDAVGNESDIFEHAVSNIDKTAPVLSNFAADITEPTNRDVKVTVDCDDADATITYQIIVDGNIVSEGVYTDGVVMEQNGTVKFQAVDKLGNTSDVISEDITNIDKDAPVISDVAADITKQTNGKVTVKATFAEDSIANEYSVDGVKWETYNAEAGVEFTQNGTVIFRAKDAVGNIREVSYTVGNIDTTAPDAPVAAADITEMTNGKVTVTATFAADSVKNEYSTDGVEWKLYLGGIVFETNGTVYFRSTDTAGNTSGVEKYEVNNIDITAPEFVEITANTTDPTNEDVVVTAVCNDADAIISYQTIIDGVESEWQVYDAEIGVVMSENGVVNFKVQDVLGNENPVIEVHEVNNIDKDAPDAPAVKADIIDPTNEKVTVTATFAEDSVKNECNINGKGWVEYKGSITFTQNGTVSFRSTDAAGNVSEEKVYNVDYIDKIAPDAPVATADITDPTNGKVTVTAEFAEYFKNEYSVDGGLTWQKYDAEKGVVFTENGSVVFRCWDNAGNYADSKVFEVTNIDKVAPKLTDIAADIANDVPTNGKVTVTAVCDDPEAKIYYQTIVDGNIVSEGVYTDGVVMEQNGTVKFSAVDAAGNYSEIGEYEVSNIDTIAPDAAVATADITTLTNGKVTVTATFAEDSVKNEYSVDNGDTWVAYDAETGVVFEKNGGVIFRSWDNAGNYADSNIFEVKNIDKDAPATPVITLSNTDPTNEDVIVMVNFAADSVLNEYSVDGIEWKVCTGSIIVKDNCTVSFRSTDAAGNVSEVASKDITNIDRIAPDAPAAFADITDATAGNVIVSATFAADSVKNEYSVDGGKTWQEYTAGYEFTDNGMIYFRSTDAAGNSVEKEYVVSNIDRVAPASPIASADITELTNQKVTVSAVFAADSVKNECNINGKGWVEYKGNITFTQNGVIQFRSTDAAGNISEVAEYIVDNIDLIAPEISMVAADITAETVENVTITAVSNDSEAVIQYFIDGVSSQWSDYVDGVVMADNGVIKFRAVDAAGNIGKEYIHEVSNIDRIAPAAPVAKADFETATNQDVTVSAEFAADSVKNEYSLDGGVTWQEYTAAIKFTANGSVSFRSTDAAGNVSKETVYNVDYIDRVAPAAPVVKADVTDITNGNVTVSAEFVDNYKNEYSVDGGATWQAYTTGVVFEKNGSVTFRIWDAAGNYADTFYKVSNIDKDVPVAPVASADITEPTNQSVSVSAVFAADSVKNEYSLDNGATWQEYTSAIVFSAIGTVLFRSTDAAGNVSAETSYEVTNIDTLAPDDPVVSADITDITNQNVTVSAVFAADSVKNEYSLDGGLTWNVYNAETGIVFEENGTVVFRTTDAVGNVNNQYNYTVTNIDKVAPVAPEVTADITDVTNSDVAVSAVFAKDAAVKQYSLDNGATWLDYSNAVVVSENSTVVFRAIDAAGNISDEVSYTVDNIDKVAPIEPVITANETGATRDNVTVSAVFASDSVKNEYSINGGAWQVYEGTILMSDNGTITFRSTDAVGNSVEKEYIVSNIDRIAPESPEIFVDIAAATKDTVTVSAEFASDSVRNEYSIDGGAWIEYTGAVVMTAYGLIVFRSIDEAGNISTESAFIDYIAPVAPVISADITTATNGNVTVSAEFAADSVKNEYTLNGTDWFEYTGSLVMSENGKITFRSTDAVGNASESEYIVSNIDKVAPEAPVVSADITAVTSKDVSVSAEFAADSVRNEYSINGGTWKVYNGAVVMSANGTITFRSTDAAGNISAESIYTVDNIDKVAPVAPVVSADITAATNKDVTVSAKFAADSAKNEYSIDGGAWKVYDGAVVMSANGTITFRSTDNAGNISAESIYTVDNIDRTAPVAPVAFADTTDWTSEQVTVSAAFAADSVRNEYSLNGTDWIAYNAAGVTVINNRTVFFRSIDAAGNISDVVSYDVTNIDNTAPVIAVKGIPDTPVNTIVVLTVEATDSASGIKNIEYSFDNKKWQSGNSVSVTHNGTVYFRATDNAGNVTVVSKAVDNITITGTPDSNLLSNGISQIVGWDSEKGTVGFIAADGNPAPAWKGIWDWDGADAALWRVVGVGHFAGSTADYDGILLYNGIGNTFAAWTDLNNPTYGYVDLCHVEDNFNTKALTNLDGNEYDDILIYNEKGSFGVVLDGTTYRDIWHVDDPANNAWQLHGAGSFDGKNEKLVVKNTSNGHLYLWQNNDPTFNTWNWSQTDIGYIGNEFEFIATGDFMGDGKDDILIRNIADGGLCIWDNGEKSTAHWVVTPGEGFAVEAVGDYNGDGKDDILVREYNTGWGGLGYYSVGGDQLWNDLNARIETDLESKFSVIA